jgi:hypothetical protein
MFIFNCFVDDLLNIPLIHDTEQDAENKDNSRNLQATKTNGNLLSKRFETAMQTEEQAPLTAVWRSYP